MKLNRIGLRQAEVRDVHRAAGCPVPTDSGCIAEPVTCIPRDAAAKGQSPEKKVAATAAIIEQLHAPIQGDLRGKHDRAPLLVELACALRRSELVTIRVDRLEKTDRGLRLTIPQTKGSQTESVVVPLPYRQTELCPVRALNAWLAAAGITDGPVFRQIWLPARGGAQSRGKLPASGKLPANGPQPGDAAEDTPPPLPQIRKAALTSRSIADIVHARAVAAGSGRRDRAGHRLKRGALTTGIERGIRPAKLKRLGRHTIGVPYRPGRHARPGSANV
jgi:hypothetical protein